MKRLLNWFKQVFLMLGFVFACQSNATAADWPTEILLSQDAKAGTILASVNINQVQTGLIGGIADNYYAFLGIDSSLANYGDPKQGVFIVKKDSSNNPELGLAFVGTITLSYKPFYLGQSTTTYYSKSAYDADASESKSGVFDRAERAGFPLLMGHTMPLGATAGEITISLVGQLVLVKLTNESLSSNTSISLPRVKLFVCNNSDRLEYEYPVVIVNGASTNVINPRTCLIEFSDLYINFGTFQSNHPSGLLNGNLKTSINVRCVGTSSNETPTTIYFQITSTDRVSDDAIGLKTDVDESPSESLVVKAKLIKSDSGSTLCSTDGGGWVKLSEKLPLDSIDKDVASYNQLHSICWSLHKLKEDSLPPGTYTGSATLSITFN